ncbi:MAG: hypothetical protein ACXVCP_09275 [Bdellovibrio sp.]
MKSQISLFIMLVVSCSFAKAVGRTDKLNDLSKMTFSCPAAALNAAAREAAKAPTQGDYQFAAFSSDGTDRVYNVSFESNFQGEPRLNYEVSVYCQQGWDPDKTVKVILKK